jgi:hypothetical protein
LGDILHVPALENEAANDAEGCKQQASERPEVWPHACGRIPCALVSCSRHLPCRMPHAIFRISGHKSMGHGLAELNYTIDHVLGRLEDDKLLSVCQENDGIWSNFHVRDQLAVEHERRVVQSGEPNHTRDAVLNYLFGSKPADQ